MRHIRKKLSLLVLASMLAPFSFVSAKNFLIHNATDVNQPYFMVNGTSGNVGIGITNPTNNLHIKSSAIGGGLFIEADGSTNSAVRLTTSGANGRLRLYNTGTANTGIDLQGNGASFINGGNVGVGTTNPQFKLQSTGNFAAFNADSTDHYILAGVDDLVGNWRFAGIKYERANNVAKFGSYLNAGLIEAGYIALNNVGNVGISTTNPSRKLHVAGDAQLDAVSFGVTPGQTQTLALATVEYVNSKSGGAAGVGTGTSGQTLRHNGTGWVADSVLFNNGTNIGIGTTNPAGKLHLYTNDTGEDDGNELTVLEQAGTGDVGIDFLFPGVKRWRVGVDNSDSDKFKIANAANFTTNTLFTLDNSGNVGIGNTNPGNKLEVAGDVQIIGSSNSSYYKANDTTNGVQVWFGVSSAVRGFIGTISNHGLGFRTNNVDRLLIDNNGNVGVGVTNPGQLLSVGRVGLNVLPYTAGLDGNILMSAASTYGAGSGSGASIIWNAALAGGVPNSVLAKIQPITNSTVNSLNFYVGAWNNNNNAGNAVLTLQQNGNVGISTTTPSRKLHVAGDVQLDAVSFGVTPGQTQTLALATVEYVNSKSGGAAGVGTGTSGQTLRHNGTGWIATSNLFNNGTNVGIGTSAPNATLQIKGGAATTSVVARINKSTFSDTGGHTSFLGFGVEPASWSKGAIGYTRTSSYDVGYLGFYLNSDNLSSSDVSLADAKMVINNSGNIGIGTTAPTNLLDVAGYGSFDNGLYINRAGNEAFVLLQDGATNIGQLRALSTTGIGFADSNGQHKMIVNMSSGNVGIGTTAPNSKLDVSSDSYDGISIPGNCSM